MDWSDALAKFYAKDDPAFANGSKQAKEAAQPVLAAVHALEKAARDDLSALKSRAQVAWPVASLAAFPAMIRRDRGGSVYANAVQLGCSV